ncbi:MAG: nucleotide cyclase [Deltaproteobacteria bacterium]|nr:MAG: nucleotide cyclase [Deltaproteobacteria bacterium]
MAALGKQLRRLMRQSRFSVLAAGGVLTLVACVLFVRKPLFFTYLDHTFYDVVLQYEAKTTHSPVPVIVDLDEASLKAFGQWPWPRYRMALLLEKIRQSGALAIGMDIVFAESDRSSPRIMQQELKQDLHLDVGFTGIPPALMDNDVLLGDILAKGPYVLGYYFTFGAVSDDQPPVLPTLKVSVIKEPGARDLEHYLYLPKGVVAPVPSLTRQCPGAGFFNTIPDRDGVLRKTPLFVFWKGAVYPSLALAALLQALPNQQVLIKVAPGGIVSMSIGGKVIPLDQQGCLHVHFKGPEKTFPYISAGDILRDQVAPQTFAGKIVFIGTSAAGLKDLRTIPLDTNYPGVEVHANIVDNILSGDFIRRPDWARGLELLLLILAGVTTTGVIAWTQSRLVLPLVLLMGAGIVYGAFWAFGQWSIVLSPVFSLMVLTGNFALLNLLKFFLAEKEKLFFRRAFSQYVAPAVVDRIVKNPKQLSLSGEEKEVSILFSDIRGFTSISEQLSPHQVSSLLHDYFSPMTRVITEHLGTLDKFIGDAIMAFWNAPMDVPDHQLKAVKTALGMLITLHEMNDDFQKRYGVNLRIGIGLHCGQVRVGNMGSAELFDYTILGDNVNLASRLEGLTKFYGVTLLVSEEIARACGDAFVRQEIDRVRVKGKNQPVTIFNLHTPERAEQFREELELYARGMALYRDQAFEKALEIFARLREDYMDIRLYALYHERCVTLMAQPPDAHWDGVFSHTSK